MHTAGYVSCRDRSTVQRCRHSCCSGSSWRRPIGSCGVHDRSPRGLVDSGESWCTPSPMGKTSRDTSDTDCGQGLDRSRRRFGDRRCNHPRRRQPRPHLVVGSTGGSGVRTPPCAHTNMPPPPPAAAVVMTRAATVVRCGQIVGASRIPASTRPGGSHADI